MRVYRMAMVFIFTFYLATRLINLTSLPVFADEAIYIRWAQLMNQDFQRWKFYPIQDGKPPLHMMVLSLFLPLYEIDPLLISRLMSVGLGLVNLWLVKLITKSMGGDKKTQLTAMFGYVILPFSWFHDRMGLIDTMLVTFLSISVYGFLELIKNRPRYLWLAGVGWGLSLWTKTSASFFILIFGLLGILGWQRAEDKRKYWGQILLAGAVGTGIFLTMKTAEVFPALFSRSQDFSFQVTDLLRGQIDHILINIDKLGRWIAAYLTWGGAALCLSGFMMKKMRQKYLFHPAWLGVMAILFMMPFLVLGKVVASRYLLPGIIFLIPSGAIILDEWWRQRKVVAVVLAIWILGQASYFGITLIFRIENTPFAKEDVEQYLTEWSAGFGIPETRDLIRERAQDRKIAVATEGYFGTLPDGLIMYFNGKEGHENVEIFGIGQPIREVPEEVKEKAKEKETYILVNEHRWKMDPKECCELVAAYPRPRGGPKLLLWRVGSEN